MKKLTIPTEGRGNARVEHLGKSIDRMIYEFMAKEDIPGMTLAIVQAPYIPRVVGYGVANAETGQLASSKTIWPAGPISQAYNAVAVMQLFERGKLELDAPISKYLDNLPEAWRGVTVFQLLQHSSGIADYRDNRNFSFQKDFTPGELVALAAEAPLSFQPGTDVRQSATNFLLLAQVVEKTSGQSYHDFVTVNQIEYLGLRRTVFQEDFSKLANEKLTPESPRHVLFTREGKYIDPAEPAVGTMNTPDGLSAAPPLHSGTLKGFSDIWASAEDVSTWDIGLAGGILIQKPENRALIYQPTKLASGKVVPAMAGWQFQHHKGLMDIKGSVPGYSAFLSRFTAADELVCVTLMCNKEGVDLSNLARRVASAFGNKLASGVDDNLFYTQESIFDLPQTVVRLENALKERNIPVFAKIDHAGNAREVNLTLAPSTVLIFGSPEIGTKLMQENPAMALELPLRIAVWQDAGGSVWVTAPQIDQTAEKYGITDKKIVGGMQKLLEKLVYSAANLY
ncbi:MAG: serine hydrolase [Victivallaceae bacterium]|nr:serine hydrolase [Victivallaceae bacterium]